MKWAHSNAPIRRTIAHTCTDCTAWLACHFPVPMPPFAHPHPPPCALDPAAKPFRAPKLHTELAYCRSRMHACFATKSLAHMALFARTRTCPICADRYTGPTILWATRVSHPASGYPIFSWKCQMDVIQRELAWTSLPPSCHFFTMLSEDEDTEPSTNNKENDQFKRKYLSLFPTLFRLELFYWLLWNCNLSVVF